LEHCGLCEELPCELFIKFRDPSLTDEAAEIALKARQLDLQTRKKIGTKKWVKLKVKNNK
jgi:hypothetical protein